jgi:predicted nucleotidyltransferase
MTSVVVKSVDAHAVRKAADAWAARLLVERPEIEEIVVFGSFAEDRWAPGSDLDVLVRLARSDVPIRDRIAPLMPAAFPVGMDLFPLTDEEIADRRGSPLIEAVGRSRWRYSRR